MEGGDVVKKAKAGSFQSMGLEKDILAGLNRMGYKAPTPVQRKALPAVLAGLDVVCMARTGSGKTCVFLLPMIQKLKSHQTAGVRGLVLSPTRELASQTFRFAKDMAKFTDLRIIDILGGDSIEAQFDALASKPDIIIATPGRLMHHLKEISTFKLKSVKYLVFDEADRLFEMGFAEQLNEIVKQCPVERQTVLFSATLPKMIVQFSRAGLKDPQLIRLDTDVKMSEELRLAFFCLRSNEKMAGFLYLVRHIIPADQQTIVFTATRHHSELIHAFLQRIGVTSTMVYGTMDQDARSSNLKAFRQGEVSYLIVTDVAARGIDVPLLNNVINFHFPPSAKLFVHRCGRAARQGRIGFAFSLVEPDEMAFMMDTVKFLNIDVKSGYSETSNGDDGNKTNEAETYTLAEMTPAMIHTGLLPQDALDEENDYVKRSLQEDDMLATMLRISENGLQQYKRTRSEATRDGVKAAKKLIKGESIRTIHPLIAGMDARRCGSDIVAKANFVRMLQTFRPSQTVFESGIGTGCSAYFSSNGTTGTNAAEVARAKHKRAADIMRAMRESTVGALERNKVKTQSLIKDDNLDEDFDADLNGDDGDDDDDDDDNEDEDSNGETEEQSDADNDAQSESDAGNEVGDDEEEDVGPVRVRMQALDDSSLVSYGSTTVKKRLSVAQRKRLRKYGSTALASSASTLDDDNEDDEDQKQKNSQKGNNYQDDKFYMSYGTEDARESFAEEAMQPLSNLRSSETFGATMMDNAFMGVNQEEEIENSRKKKIMRWDPKKRKFVQQTLQEMAQSKKSGLKRMRSESGVVIKSSSKEQGEMYEKWKKKRKIEINSEDDGRDADFRKRPNFKINNDARDELRNTSQIRKIVKGRENMRLKNMEKGKRRKIETAVRQKKNQAINENRGGGRAFAGGKPGGRDGGRGGGSRGGSGGRGGSGRGGGGGRGGRKGGR